MASSANMVGSPDVLHHIIESIPIRVFWKDRDSRYLGCNSLFAEDAGVDRPASIVGLTDDQLGWREQAEAYRADDRAVMESGVAKIAFEERQTSPSGALLWLRTSKVPLRDEAGRVIGVLGIYEDITVRKETESRLRESEDRYRAMVEQSPIASHVVAPDGSTRSANAAWSRLWGVPLESLAQYDLLGDVQWVARGIVSAMERAFAGETVVMPEAEYDRASPSGTPGRGGRIWVRTRLYPVFQDDGALREVVLLQEDLTTFKQAEAALSDSEHRFQRLFENSPDPCWIIDADNRFSLCNQAAAHVLGYARAEDVIACHPSEHSPDVQPDGTSSLVKANEMMAIAHARGVHRFEWVHRRRNGETFPVEVTLAAIGSAGERQLYCIWRDISERKRFEQSLLETRLLHEEAQRIAHLGHWQLDLTANRIEWSQEVYRIFGVAPHAFDGTREGFLARVHPDDLERVRTAYAASLKERILFDIEHRVRTEEGATKWVHVRGENTYAEDGTPLRTTGTVLDITEEQEAQEERERLQAQLHDAQRLESVGRLAGGVAHDFNNMLTVILGGAEVALASLPSDHAAFACLKDIQDAAHRSADLTRQLLAFASRQTTRPVVLDLNTTIESTLRMLSRIIGENITLVWTAGEGVWPIRMDPSQIDQILANLCVNARDAITGVGHVRIATSNVSLGADHLAPHAGVAAGDHAVLAFSDDGCGMTADVLEHIFEPFFTTKGIGKGTGLGLATVYGIVRQNGGHIEVASRPGAGTTFQVYLPAHRSGASADRVSETDGRARRGAETVLLVEDEPGVMRMTRLLLERLGYVVLAAPSGDVALRLVRTHGSQIRLLVTDVIMPDMNGRDLSRLVRAALPGLPTLLMSGYPSDSIRIGDELDDQTHFIAKPFTLDSLGSKLRQVLRRQPDPPRTPPFS